MNNTTKNYSVQTNVANQKVIVIGDFLKSQEVYDVIEENGDVILITSTDIAYVYTMLEQFRSYISSEGFIFMTPIFLHPNIKTVGQMMQLADGVTYSFDDENLIKTVSDINRKVTTIKSYKRGEFISPYSSQNIMEQIITFIYSRGTKLPTPNLKRGTSFGYTRGISEVFFKFGLITPKEYDIFIKDIIKKGIIKHEKFIEKVHICPNCYNSHLIYSEVCPKCHSANIQEVEIIHHFPCAYVAPANDFVKGGDLVCPKCRKLLKHIGVDYDRPTSIFNCLNCFNSFSVSKMKVTCVVCGKQSTPDQLLPIDIYDYSITESGIRDYILNSKDNDRSISTNFENYGMVSFSVFEDCVHSRMSALNIIDSETKMYIVRIRIINSFILNSRDINKIEDQFAQTISSAFVGKIMSFHSQVLYVLTDNDNLDATIAQVRQKLQNIVNTTMHDNRTGDVLCDYVQYKVGDDKSQFLRNFLIV